MPLMEPRKKTIPFKKGESNSPFLKGRGQELRKLRTEEVTSFSAIRNATPSTVAPQAPLCMEFSRQDYS